MTVWSLPSSQDPPDFCQYASGPCNQTFLPQEGRRVFFAYASQPAQIAEVVERAAERLQNTAPGIDWHTWRDMSAPGQLVFCEICKQMRNSVALVADVTTLNFNLMFEIGFAIGLEIPVILIRDPSIAVHRKEFAAIGLLDTVIQLDFENSDDLVAQLRPLQHHAR
jgi:nucleoside 2-deoxyribosyltransferase